MVVSRLPGMPIILITAVLVTLLAPTPPAARSPLGGSADGESAATGLVVVDTPMTSPRWRPPIRGSLTVRRGFDRPEHRWSRGHRGVDLAARRGSVIQAAGSGRIVFAGVISGRGVVSIQHAPGVRTTYEPVQAIVTAGQHVRGGDAIGRLTPDRRHRDSLHWGLRIRDGYADPMRLLRTRPKLKPTRSHDSPAA